jgi:hypothetical protein
MPRRSFLKISGLAMGGLSLPQILEAQASSATASKNTVLGHKALIMVFLTGGPPHQDMVDLKPDAPSEVRGELNPIKTNVPGIEISELMPRMAKMMDKFAVIRSLVGAAGPHYSYQCTTGRTPGNAPRGGWPEIGSIISKEYGRVDPSVTPTIDLSRPSPHLPFNLPGPGFLGAAHKPFKPTGESIADMILNVDSERLNRRKGLVSSMDRFRRTVDQKSAEIDNLDPYTRQAFDVLTSSKLVEALDLEREDPKVRERYGKDNPDVRQGAYVSDFLKARRCVEAGARCVTVSFSDWDFHTENFKQARVLVPLLDQGLTALVQDLHDRGLDKDVSVLVWGEFGRMPRINKEGGRDHWTPTSCALLAGGGMQTGQVLGKTNRLAEYPIDRPVHFQEVFATVYHNLGIDVNTATITDLAGRPHYLLDDPTYQPIAELV